MPKLSVMLFVLGPVFVKNIQGLYTDNSTLLTLFYATNIYSITDPETILLFKYKFEVITHGIYCYKRGFGVLSSK